MPSHSMLKWEDTCVHQVNHVSNCYDELEWLGGSVKNPPANAGDMGSIPGLRSPGEGNANPLQYSCLGSPLGHKRARHNLVTEKQKYLNQPNMTDFPYLSYHWVLLAIVVQSLNHVWLFVTPWTAACQIPLSSTVSWSLLKFMSIELVMLSYHLILCHPLLLLPSIFPSIRIFLVQRKHFFQINVNVMFSV